MIKYEIRFIVMITVARAPNLCFMPYEPPFELLEMMAEIPISRFLEIKQSNVLLATYF